MDDDYDQDKKNKIKWNKNSEKMLWVWGKWVELSMDGGGGVLGFFLELKMLVAISSDPPPTWHDLSAS